MGCIALPAAAACWAVCLLALPAGLTAACGAQAAAQTAQGRGGGDQKGQRATAASGHVLRQRPTRDRRQRRVVAQPV